MKKLHLHLGAHKTATTHFQTILESNGHFFPKEVFYEPMHKFRENLKWRHEQLLETTSIEYLNHLVNQDKSVLIVSEENLMGETKDIFKYPLIYGGMKPRLRSLNFFYEQFDEVEIWFGIRTMDEFIPSIYCEYLRHFKYRKFVDVFHGDINQSWVSVVEILQAIFPKSKINIFPYEGYIGNLRSVLNSMVSNMEKWDLLMNQRVRTTVTGQAIKLYSHCHFLIPIKLKSSTIDSFNKLSSPLYAREKYNPLTETEKRNLKSLYYADLSELKEMKNVYVL